MELKKQSDYEQYIRQDSLGEYYVVLNQYTFHSVYQPIFDKHQEMIGMEALLRIRGVDGSLSIRPDLFFTDSNSMGYPLPTLYRISSRRAIHIRNFARHFAGSPIKLFLKRHACKRY